MSKILNPNETQERIFETSNSIKFYDNEYIILIGETGSGKSTFLNKILMDLNDKTLIFSLEMTTNDLCYKIYKMGYTYDQLSNHLEIFDQLDILQGSISTNIIELKTFIIKKSQEGVKNFVIDHMQLLAESPMDEKHYSNMFIELSLKLNIRIFIVNQISVLNTNTKKDANNKLLSSSKNSVIRGSQQNQFNATKILKLEREKINNQRLTKLTIEKDRFGDQKDATFYFDYDEKFKQIEINANNIYTHINSYIEAIEITLTDPNIKDLCTFVSKTDSKLSFDGLNWYILQNNKPTVIYKNHYLIKNKNLFYIEKKEEFEKSYKK